MTSLYTTVKVHNEIELCEVSNLECKQLIERALLQNRISYFIRWPKPSLFRRDKNTCIICINDSARESAEAVIRSICDETGHSVRFIFKKSVNNFL